MYFKAVSQGRMHIELLYCFDKLIPLTLWKCLSLSLVTFFVLKSALSNDSIATLNVSFD